MLESAAPVLATVSGGNTITLRLRVAVMGGSRTKSVCIAKGVQGAWLAQLLLLCANQPEPSL